MITTPRLFAATQRRLTGPAEIFTGSALLIAGPRAWRALTGEPSGQYQELAIRLLGGRYLGQGWFQLRWPGRLLPLWAAVDLLHAATMTVLAIASRRMRRPAVLSAAAAAINGTAQLIAHHHEGTPR